MSKKIKIPCTNCIVFPMCKQRVIEHELIFNLSGLFAYIKGHCELVQEDYYEYRRFNPRPKDHQIDMPYSEIPFCKEIYKHFQVGEYATPM